MAQRLRCYYFFICPALLLCLACSLYATPAAAQSADQATFRQGTRYIDLNLHALDKFSARATRTRERLLKRLARKEKAFASQLRSKDSTAYARYREQSASQPSFDSILTLSHQSDSLALSRKPAHSSQAAIDSLKGVAAFLKSSAGTIAGGDGGDAAKLAGYSTSINSLQAKLDYQHYLDGLINNRVAGLQSAASLSGAAATVPALGGMQQELYYAKSKIAVYRQMADDPSKAEEKALEYLQGREGFDGKLDAALNGDNPLSAASAVAAGGGTSSGGLTADDLERMGYQTRRQVNAGLQKQFGSGLGAVQGQMGQQVGAWQQKVQGLVGDVKETVSALNGGLRDLRKPTFKINSMRGLPFWKRIEKSYSFNTRRAVAGQPALLSMAVMAGFKQSPKVSAGVGIAGDLGLGQSFSEVHFSFQGLGLRTYLSWQAIWGIGAYAGYERTYKNASFQHSMLDISKSQFASQHNSASFSDAIFLGLTKSYHINRKYAGACQVLFDFWWIEKKLNSPLILRFVTQLK